MATKRNHKVAAKAVKTAKVSKGVKRRGKSVKAVPRKGVAKAARKPKAARAPLKAAAKPVKAAAKPAAKPALVAKSGHARPASVKKAAKALAAVRASAASKHRPPSYIPHMHADDWMLTGPIELPAQPRPAAHTPTRKPPKPRAPKPKAISHEQALANLRELVESRKRRAAPGAGVAKSA